MTDSLGPVQAFQGKVVLWHVLASTPAAFQSCTWQILLETHEFIYGYYLCKATLQEYEYILEFMNGLFSKSYDL